MENQPGCPLMFLPMYDFQNVQSAFGDRRWQGTLSKMVGQNVSMLPFLDSSGKSSASDFRVIETFPRPRARGCLTGRNILKATSGFRIQLLLRMVHISVQKWRRFMSAAIYNTCA